MEAFEGALTFQTAVFLEELAGSFSQTAKIIWESPAFGFPKLRGTVCICESIVCHIVP